MILSLSNVITSPVSAGRLRMDWLMPLTGGPAMPGNEDLSATRILTRDDKHHLATIIANMLQPHLSTRNTPTSETEKPTTETNQSTDSRSSFNQTQLPIKEDYDANHRSKIHQDNSITPPEERLCLSASIEHGTSS
jgi:hypothetical protein